jgi:hypothetical protein
MACEEDRSEPLAPAVASLEPAPSTPHARTFAVKTATSAAKFVMDAPLEKIYGELEQGITGELSIDAQDLTKSTGLIKVDLMKLVLYQQKRASEQEEYGERKKSDKQNEHMRTWLEISPDAPAKEREKNRWVSFQVTALENLSTRDVSKLAGKPRKVTATVVGDVLLHGRKTSQKAKVELTFTGPQETIDSVHIATLEPLIVDLRKHDVRPREAFGKLAQMTLEKLGQKVAGEVPVELTLDAKAR